MASANGPAAHEFDQDYWDRHWAQRPGGRPAAAQPPNPYLSRETSSLAPGTALDAGCGTGAEAIWLAARGWAVTAADIAAEALARAAQAPGAGRVRWVEADLTSWAPETQFDLVTTCYAHPAMPQLAFYQRLATWVAPGGTLLIIGHRPAGHGDEHEPPAHATVTAAGIAAVLDEASWQIVTAEEHTRTVTGDTVSGHPGETVTLFDVVVRARLS